MNLADISPLILTYNEERNIERTLNALAWARRIVVLDSHSSDATATLVQKFANVDLHARTFDTHAAQWNAGLSLIETPWVLTLDADYVPSAGFLEELKQLDPNESICYFAPLRFCLGGRALACSILPPRPVLFQTGKCSYYNDGHTQRLAHDGNTVTLRSEILHIDNKSLYRWYQNQKRYAELEAEKLSSDHEPTTTTARLRRVPFLMVVIAPLHILISKKGIFEFWQGWAYAGLRAGAECMISLARIKHLLRHPRK